MRCSRGAGFWPWPRPAPTRSSRFRLKTTCRTSAPEPRRRVSADAYPQDTFSAVVTLVAPSVDPAQGTVEVRLQAESPRSTYLRPGMTVSVNLETGARTARRRTARRRRAGPRHRRPLGSGRGGGRAQRRPVTLGLRGDAWVEVTDGLASGEAVVLAADEVEPGDRIRARAGS